MDSKLGVPATDEQQYESEVSDYGGAPSPPPYRRASESSTERSLYDEKFENLGSSQSTLPGPVHEYGWYRPKVLSRGLIITDATGADTGTAKTPLYYLELSVWTIKKPDVTLHTLPVQPAVSTDLDRIADTGESGPVLGVAHLPRLSRTYHVGLGDPATNSSITWVDIKNPNKAWHGEYQFSFNGRALVWKRTQDAAAGVQGGSATRAVSRASFQLLDSATNEVIAVYLQNKFKSWKKKGKLRIFKDLEASSEGQELKLVIFLSMAAIQEKARRRAAGRNSAAAGASG